MSSLVYLLVWSPPFHTPYVSSPNQCLYFAAHAHTIAAVTKWYFNVFRVVFGKKHAVFWWKDAIFGFPVFLCSAEAQVRWGGKIKYILIAYFLSNTCAKNCHNQTVYVNIIASQRSEIFLRHGVVSLYFIVSEEKPSHCICNPAYSCACPIGRVLAGRISSVKWGDWWRWIAD